MADRTIVACDRFGWRSVTDCESNMLPDCVELLFARLYSLLPLPRPPSPRPCAFTVTRPFFLGVTAKEARVQGLL